MKFSIAILFAVYLTVVVSTPPLPLTTYEPQIGDVALATPQSWRDPIGTPHFGIIVGQDTITQKYLFAHTSRNLLPKYLHRDNAQKYHHLFSPNAQISTGRPVYVDKENLRLATVDRKNGGPRWPKVEDKSLEALQKLINTNCEGSEQGGSCASDPQVPGPKRLPKRLRRKKKQSTSAQS